MTPAEEMREKAMHMAIGAGERGESADDTLNRAQKFYEFLSRQDPRGPTYVRTDIYGTGGGGTAQAVGGGAWRGY